VADYVPVLLCVAVSATDALVILQRFSS